MATEAPDQPHQCTTEAMNASDDFVKVSVIAHVTALTLKHFHMRSLRDKPNHRDLWKIHDRCSQAEKQEYFHQALVSTCMLKPHVHLFTTAHFDTECGPFADRVQLYAQEAVTLGLLHSEFKDSTREGDGKHIYQRWKLFLPIFEGARKCNYATEAVTYLAKTTVLLPPQLRKQPISSCFVNKSGREGGNIAADLHMEHLNRIVKTALGQQFSNLQPQSILHAGRICGLLDSICRVFDSETSVTKRSTSHTASSFMKDLNKSVSS